MPILKKNQILFRVIHLPVDCTTPLKFLYARYADVKDYITRHLGTREIVQRSKFEPHKQALSARYPCLSILVCSLPVSPLLFALYPCLSILVCSLLVSPFGAYEVREAGKGQGQSYEDMREDCEESHGVQERRSSIRP